MIDKIKRNNEYIVPLIWLAIGYVWDILYHLIAGKIMTDSDMSSEMILASILNQEHSITGLTHNWRYGSEIRVFEMQWFYRIGLWLFPNDWHYARTFSMALALAVMVIGILLLFWAVDQIRLGVWAAAFSVFPGGSWYFWQTIYGGYYMIYILISIYSMVFIFLLIKNNSKTRNILLISILIAISVASGLNGIKQIMVFHAPLCITAVIIFILCRCRKNLKDIAYQSFLLYSIVATISAYIGYIINSKVLSNFYEFKQYSERPIEHRDILELIRYYIWNFGYAEGKILMSPQGIASMCGVVFGILVMMAGIRLMARLLSLSGPVAVLVSFCFVSILLNCFIMSYTNGEIQYFQPTVPLGYFLLVLEIGTEPFVLNRSRIVIMLSAIVILCIASAGTTYNEEHEPFHPYRAHPKLKAIVDMLVNKGYTDGVSMFWTSNIVTELSNGRIDMWTVNIEYPDQWDPWLQRVDHMGSEPKGRYFYIFDYTFVDVFLEDKIELGEKYIREHGTPTPLKEIYADESYIIYGN